MNPILHAVSKDIASQGDGIIMENLTGIRKLYKRGNGQGKNYRGRMNSWAFREMQRQIEYKENWNCLPVMYESAWGTSSKHSVCGSRMVRIPEESRMLRCPKCNVTVDRHVDAARSILARGVRLTPYGLPVEAMKGNPLDLMVIPVADGSKNQTVIHQSHSVPRSEAKRSARRGD